MSEEIRRSAGELQQQLATLFAAKDIISWDLYDEDDERYLVRKIELLIPNVEKTVDNAERENADLEKLRTSLIAALWNQRKYYGGKLLMSIQYVICTKEIDNLEDAVSETEYTVYPVFRVRKCCCNDDSSNCCMIFIDNNARVYQNWASYMTNNILPKGVLVAPKNGYYNFDSNDHVLLECALTPASTILSRIGDVANKTAGIVGVGAATVTLTALAFPVAAPVLAAAAILGLGSGLWGAGAAAKRLIDRGTHEESIHLKDSKARSDWIGVAGGVVSLGASGATAVLSQHAAMGQGASDVLMGTVSGLNIATIAISGVGVGNGIFEIILKRVNDEEISALDVLQLGSSLFVLTHSVYNFETASRIVAASQDGTVQNTRKELSKQQRKQLGHAHKTLTHLLGMKRRRIDVIRALNVMPDSKHFERSTSLDESTKVQILTQVIDIIGETVMTAAGDTAYLADTIDNIMAHVNDPNVLYKLSKIVKDFFQWPGLEIERQLNRFIPLEEILWIAFKIIYKLCEGEDVDDFLRNVNDSFVMKKLETYYKNLIPNLGESKECKTCKGHYTLCTL